MALDTQPLMRSGVWVAGFLLALSSLAMGQQGGFLIGHHASVLGRGGTDVGFAEEGSALLSNPAGLVQSADTWRLETSLALYTVDVRYRDAFQPTGERSRSSTIVPSFTLTWKPDSAAAPDEGLRFALGLLHLEGNQSSFDLSTQDFPAPLTTRRDADYLHTAVHLGVAYGVTREWSFGVTAALTYSDLEVEEPLEIPIGSFQGMSPLGTPWGTLLMKNFGVEALRIPGTFESDPLFGGAVTLGVLWQPSEDFQAGLSLRHQLFTGHYEGPVDVDITRIFGEPDPVTFPDGFAVSYDGALKGLDHPTTVALGVSLRITNSLRVGMDVRFTAWSQSHERIRLALRNGDNPGFNAFVGGDRLDVIQELDWQDQWSVSLGLEWEFEPGLRFRVGGFLQESPVPDASTNPSAPAFARAGLSAGIGYAGSDFLIDLAYMHVFPESQGVGRSLTSSDLDNSRTRVATDILLLTVTLRF